VVSGSDLSPDRWFTQPFVLPSHEDASFSFAGVAVLPNVAVDVRLECSLTDGTGTGGGGGGGGLVLGTGPIFPSSVEWWITPIGNGSP
jgi:hypothetical protein